MFFRSLRFKLVVWNLVVLGVALIAFSAAQSYNTIRRLESDIDRELEMRARGAVDERRPPPGQGPGQGFGRQGGPGGPGGPGPGFNQPPPGMGPPMGQDPGGPRRGPNGNGPGAPPPGFASDLRRPRFLDPQGQGTGGDRGRKALDPAAIQEALKGHVIFTTVQAADGQRLRVYTVPLPGLDRPAGAVQVAHELTDVDLLSQGQWQSLFFLLPAALLLAGAGAFFLAERALRPIGSFTRSARQIGAGDLSQRLEIVGSDEFADLGQTFNEMISRLETSFGDLRKAYGDLEVAYGKQRQFTADASHELRTPLTRLKLATSSALASDGSPADYEKAVKVADRAAADMARLIEQLLMLARADAGALAVRNSAVDLRLVASDAVSSYPSERRIEVSFAKDPVDVLGDADLLLRVVTNLVENALRYSEDRVLVSVYTQGSEAILEVQDNGEGIASEHLPKLFDRFYRVDASRTRSAGGTGLGLAICKSIVEAHNGRIQVASEHGVGTRFRISLPILRKAVTQTNSS